MGNYQEHLKKINPLREVDSGSVRTQLFGNPFKLERSTDNKVIVNCQFTTLPGSTFDHTTSDIRYKCSYNVHVLNIHNSSI